jgi:hypothetical protein
LELHGMPQPTIMSVGQARELAPVVIRAMGALPANTKVFLTVPDKQDIQSILVFPNMNVNTQKIWGSLGDRIGGAAEPTSVDITALVNDNRDHTLGIEGLFFRSTGAINTFTGFVTLSLELRDNTGKKLFTDTIKLKVAPWMMTANDQASTAVYAADAGKSNAEFLHNAKADPGYFGLDNSGQLQTVNIQSAVTDPGSRDQWLQDHIEIGFTQRPGGPRDSEVFRLPRPLDGGALATWPLTKLLGPTVGVFAIGRRLPAGDSGDFGGNLEIMPPIGNNRLGTIIVGDTMSAALRTFLTSQEVQPVVQIPTSWLEVGHVDEAIGFTGQVDRGGRPIVVLANPTDAFDMLSDVNIIPVADRGSSVFFATGNADPVAGTTTANSANNNLIDANIDFTTTPWQYVRVYAGAGAGQIAHISKLKNGSILVDKVWDVGSTITLGTVHPPAAPAPQATWFRNPMAGDQFVLVQDTKFWVGAGGRETPAFVTVQELLGDAALRNLNTMDAQSQLDDVETALNTAAGGVGNLDFISVPEIFVGTAAGFAAGRSAVAFTPGMANVQPINGKLYFARQFSPEDALGNDLFEEATSAQLTGALFVDDWDLYHRLDGEVHCGSYVKRNPAGPNWWTRI